MCLSNTRIVVLMTSLPVSSGSDVSISLGPSQTIPSLLVWVKVHSHKNWTLVKILLQLSLRQLASMTTRASLALAIMWWNKLRLRFRFCRIYCSSTGPVKQSSSSKLSVKAEDNRNIWPLLLYSQSSTLDNILGMSPPPPFHTIRIPPRLYGGCSSSVCHSLYFMLLDFKASV